MVTVRVSLSSARVSVIAKVIRVTVGTWDAHIRGRR